MNNKQTQLNEHVTHLITAYAEEQLPPHVAEKITRHIRDCSYCRVRLAAHTRLSADLRLALASNPAPRCTQINSWWQSIKMHPQPKRGIQYLSSFLVPVALSLLILIIPMTGSVFMSGYGTVQGNQQAQLQQIDNLPLTTFPPETITSVTESTTVIALATPSMDALTIPTIPVPQEP